MSSIQSLRRLVYTVRKKILRQGHSFRPKPVIPGLPETITHETLSSLCLDFFSSPLVSASHQHLSAWKASGAYRLLLTLRNGREYHWILKEASYEQEEIPALIGLPAAPGKAEYSIYSQSAPPLEPYLPDIILAEEIIPGVRYRYILEDLSDKYQRISPKDTALKAGALIPELHKALQAWTDELKVDALIKYGEEFSRSLQIYAVKNLTQFYSQVNNSVLQEVFEVWPELAGLHLQQEFFQYPMSQPIHGDLNYTNIHISKTGPDRLKLVDWEWAGVGSPFADLASLTKGASAATGNAVFNAFTKAGTEGESPLDGLSPEQLQRIYHWCQLERGMLDAGFLAAQYLHSDQKTGFSLSRAVCSSLNRMLIAYQQLSR